MALLPESFDVRLDDSELRRQGRSAVRYSWWAIGIALCTLLFSLVVAWLT